MFVIEKNTGRVQRVVGGVVQSTVLDLAVNSASERGLLGIALHPSFSTNGWVYLFWTCRTAGPPADPFFPDEEECVGSPALGADSEEVLEVPLLANRVDRFSEERLQMRYEDLLSSRGSVDQLRKSAFLSAPRFVLVKKGELVLIETLEELGPRNRFELLIS
jgi:hypothetical protein